MRRSVRVDVEEFVAARADTLLRTAYLLTGDPARAEQLLETGLAHAWATWGHSELGPESTVRAAMVRQRDLWWPTRRRDAGRDPTRDPRWAALDRLSRRQRAALVLCCFDDVPEDDAAEILGCQVGTLRRRLARAREAFGVPDPAQALAALADPVSPRERRRPDRGRRAPRRGAAGLAQDGGGRVADGRHRRGPGRGRGPATTPRRQADALPQLNMVEPPPALVGYQLRRRSTSKTRCTRFFRSQASAPGQPVAAGRGRYRAPAAAADLVRPVALTGWIVVASTATWSRADPGAADRGLLCHRGVASRRVRTTRPDVRCGSDRRLPAGAA